MRSPSQRSLRRRCRRTAGSVAPQALRGSSSATTMTTAIVMPVVTASPGLPASVTRIVPSAMSTASAHGYDGASVGRPGTARG